MCGITGFYQVIKPIDEVAVIKDMLSMIEHRGPDQAGFYANKQVAIGTMRLSIIDVAAGTQPVSDPSGRFWLSYNGELYNYVELRAELRALGHTFVTQSDTEVVLHSLMEWGEAALSRFNGAFAFALFDAHTQGMLLARDRFGKRPLFYTSAIPGEPSSGLLFGSEMKCFLAFPDFPFSFDSEALSAILAHWTPLPDQTCFNGIKQLPPGCVMRLAKGREAVIAPYYQLDFREPSFKGTQADAEQAIRTEIEQAVKLRLRSDVPMGVYLSGGVDSSILTSIASQAIEQKPLRTFSVEFEDADFDESADQAVVSDLFGTDHYKLNINGRDIADNFSMAVFHGETPLFRTAPVPMYMLSKHVRDAGIKAILSGEGADEVFLGYNIFKETLLRSQWHDLDNEQRKQRIAKLYPYLKSFSEENYTHYLGLYNRYAEEQLAGLFSHEIRFQNGRFANRLLRQQHQPFALLQQALADSPIFPHLDLLQKAQWLEFNTLLNGYLLSSQGERMGLAHGVENRCPFLDINVQRLASSLNLQFDDGTTEKYLLRQAYQGRLPSRIIDKAKTPYRAPDSAPFVTHQSEFLSHILGTNTLESMEVIDQKFAKALINKIVKRHREGEQDVTVRDNQAFVYLMSIIELNKWFVKGEGKTYIDASKVERLLVTGVDARH